MVHFGTARSDHYQGKQVFLLVKEWVFIFHYARSPIELYIQNFSAQAFEGNIVAKMELVDCELFIWILTVSHIISECD